MRDVVRRGNFDWKRQVGARGPTGRDTGLTERTEEWQGPEETYDQWIADYPVGSGHPIYPYLKLCDPDPEDREAGMRRVALQWVGGQPNENGLIFGQSRSGPRPSLLRNPQSQTVSGTMTYRFDVSDETHPQGRASTVIQGTASVEVTTSYYAPTFTLRYGSTRFIAAPEFEELGASLLAASGGLEVYDKSLSQSKEATLRSIAVGTKYVMRLKDGDELLSGDPREQIAYILPGDVQSLADRYDPTYWDTISQTQITPDYVSHDVSDLPTRPRNSTLTCNPRTEGIYEVVEGWTLQLEVNSL